MQEDRVYSVNGVVDALGQLDGRTIQIAGTLNIRFEADSIKHIPQVERRDGYGSFLRAYFDLEALGSDRDGLRQFASRHVVVTATVVREFDEHMDLFGAVVVHAIAKLKRH